MSADVGTVLAKLGALAAERAALVDAKADTHRQWLHATVADIRSVIQTYALVISCLRLEYKLFVCFVRAVSEFSNIAPHIPCVDI